MADKVETSRPRRGFLINFTRATRYDLITIKVMSELTKGIQESRSDTHMANPAISALTKIIATETPIGVKQTPTGIVA